MVLEPEGVAVGLVILVGVAFPGTGLIV
jgi:hypothetical protein